MTKSSAEKIAFCGIMTSLSLILSYIEYLIPLSFLVKFPGIKLGLANICVIFCFFKIGKFESFIISFIRVVLSSLLFGNPASFLYSALGAFFAFCFLFFSDLLLKNRFSLFGVSIGCAVMHNIGQLFAQSLMFSNFAVFSYLVYLIPAGLIMGGITGIILLFAEDRIKITL